MSKPLTRTLIVGGGVGLSGTSLMARIRGSGGSLITQASISTITYTVSNLTAGTSGTSTSLTVSSVIYDTLQQGDPRWTKDRDTDRGVDGTHGFNFLATIPSTAFAIAVLTPANNPTFPDNVLMQVDVVFTPVTGQPFRVPFQFRTQAVFA